jgi:hypothetical protein
MMLNNPALIQITRAGGDIQPLDIFPIYRQEGEVFVTTGGFRLYEGYPDDEEQLERYLENIDLEGEAHPGFLGELHFHGTTVYEWQYQGTQLTEAEVLQVVELLQDNQPVFLSGNDADSTLAFTYDHFHVRSYVQLMADEGRFLVFVNGGFAAEIELMETDWEVTGGELEFGLEKEVLRRIRSIHR